MHKKEFLMSSDYNTDTEFQKVLSVFKHENKTGELPDWVTNEKGGNNDTHPKTHSRRVEKCRSETKRRGSFRNSH